MFDVLCIRTALIDYTLNCVLHALHERDYQNSFYTLAFRGLLQTLTGALSRAHDGLPSPGPLLCSATATVTELLKNMSQ